MPKASTSTAAENVNPPAAPPAAPVQPADMADPWQAARDKAAAVLTDAARPRAERYVEAAGVLARAMPADRLRVNGPPTSLTAIETAGGGGVTNRLIVGHVMPLQARGFFTLAFGDGAVVVARVLAFKTPGTLVEGVPAEGNDYAIIDTWTPAVPIAD